MHEESITAEIIEELAALHREVAILKPLSARAKLAEDEFGHFFTHSIDLLCIAGFDGYFKRVNPAWTICLGRTLEELEARPFIDFVHPDDREATELEIGAIAEGAKTILFENRYRHRDGSYRWLRWNARAVPGRQKIYAIAQDVTRQKRQEREILEIADREKDRLGRELHDGLCQTLAGIAALGATLSRTLAATLRSRRVRCRRRDHRAVAGGYQRGPRPGARPESAWAERGRTRRGARRTDHERSASVSRLLHTRV